MNDFSSLKNLTKGGPLMYFVGITILIGSILAALTWLLKNVSDVLDGLTNVVKSSRKLFKQWKKLKKSIKKDRQ